VDVFSDVSRDTFLVGATTYSTAVSGDNCSDGCGMLASWDKSLQEFNQRVIFSHTRSVLSISTNEDTSAVVFSRKLDDGSDGHVISFL